MGQKSSLGKNMAIGFAVMIPLLLVVIGPWLISFAKPEWRDSSFPIIWALSSFGIMFAFVVFILIYSSVTNTELSKTKLWKRIFG